ncbi:hypothetical protein PR048_007016 [Dryococelus australis]|uniref:Uncharacterized protein n=1 Tax=Dryococelus australis TaxID=614101 RepID=A0ABQ9ICH2_9NEOP|nr:hypothetical protein PR048_007016 [Dryococelus australis]
MHTFSKNIREERAIKPLCSEKCKLQCSTKFSEEEREKLFSSYWDLGDLGKRRQYIANSMEFDISFFVPKNDLCDFCSAFDNAGNNEEENTRGKYDNHVKEKDLSRKEKNTDKINNEAIVAAYDLQAVIQRKGDVSVLLQI